jgi:hypothetical protein
LTGAFGLVASERKVGTTIRVDVTAFFTWAVGMVWRRAGQATLRTAALFARLPGRLMSLFARQPL